MFKDPKETSLGSINPREDTIDVDHILKMMNYGDILITPGKNTTEVIFLGPMRSGKSTLMSLFGGSSLYSIGSVRRTYSIDSERDPKDIL
jgi:ABC-type hemin transport system ATPase subunit